MNMGRFTKKGRGKRWIAKNGTSYKRRVKDRARRRNDPQLKAMRDTITAQKRAEGHPGYPPPGHRGPYTPEMWLGWD